ncbi:hypothetical protein B9Z51_12810 [Limnohabitans sp. T6-5]|uniref:TPM domain-containing protein n=1 Tax=Limnohabitans sp. T6-5 TaxID=1100724 RepID=UPI000D38BBD8|nr:TPM domain-containing protein [Limnohabitans sp. T6-5]PUE07243.1 hypothetical protein B9Z51_12810 [Limnohabitans sp. T6-5]
MNISQVLRHGLQALPLWWRHALADVRGSHGAFPVATLARIEAQVAASERQHTGQIRVSVETHLPRSYLWRFVRQATPIKTLIHQRAVMLFSKLRVWDTQHNNGVLIHVLMAERAIEVVADRGVAEQVSAAHWQAVVQPMQAAFAQGQFESGLLQAVDAVTALLVQHCPRPETVSSQRPERPGHGPANELPDAPAML